MGSSVLKNLYYVSDFSFFPLHIMIAGTDRKGKVSCVLKKLMCQSTLLAKKEYTKVT